MNNLVPGQSASAVISVSALNRLARDILERSLPLTWVRGEVSNFTSAASGHWYFTLKDAVAQVRCAMFRGKARFVDWRPENGMQVEVRALPTVYEPRGEFQLNVESMRRAGLGALYEAFERLKARLEGEGLFDPARKRVPPVFPRAIGVVTSPQAAALRDTLKILAQRMPAIPVIVYPTPVQGGGAARSIATMIATASARCECDVLIVCRGGGSLEDLWAFNDEGVARAIHACSMAVVTGIGHETDFTIADFVADLRAPTPSAAAQVVCPDRHELQRMRAEQARALARAMRRSLERRMQQLDYLGRCLVDPRERLQAELQRLQHLASRLTRAATARVVHARWALRDCARQLLLARFDPAERSAQLQRASLRLDAATARAERARSAALDNLSARLETLNPRAVLARGYAIAADRAGRIVRDSAQIRVGEPLTVQFARGSAETEVRTIDLGAADAQMRDRR